MAKAQESVKSSTPASESPQYSTRFIFARLLILQYLTQYVSICIMNIPYTDYQMHIDIIKATELATWLLSRGTSSITTHEIASLLGVPKNQVPQRLAPLKRRGEIVQLAKGLWAPVPPEYLTWGAPPAIDVIDALMRYVSVHYYVGWLSAAELHGASHHAPQVFQVAVSRAIRQRKIGRSNFCFFFRDHIHLATTVNMESKNGAVPVSSRETTMLDIVSDIECIGGIDNAANIIIELCEASAPDFAVINELSSHYPMSAIRRLGFLLEHFTDTSELELLRTISENSNTTVSLLDPQSDNIGSIDKHWRLKINKEVSPDI